MFHDESNIQIKAINQDSFWVTCSSIWEDSTRGKVRLKVLAFAVQVSTKSGTDQHTTS